MDRAGPWWAHAPLGLCLVLALAMPGSSRGTALAVGLGGACWLLADWQERRRQSRRTAAAAQRAVREIAASGRGPGVAAPAETADLSRQYDRFASSIANDGIINLKLAMRVK